MGLDRRQRELDRLDADLRKQLSDTEYRRLMRQLQGAVSAFTLLQQRAPAFFGHFFPQGAPRVSTTLEEVPGASTPAMQAALGNFVKALRSGYRAAALCGADPAHATTGPTVAAAARSLYLVKG